MQREIEKFAVLLFLLISLTCAAVPEPDAKHVLLDDGTRGTRILVQGAPSNFVSRGHEVIQKCEPGEYLEENGNCYKCFVHNAFCNSSKQCCEPNMSCYRYYNSDPMCKCDADYAWDDANGVCYHAPVPAILLVTAYTAIAAACIVGITAILFNLVGAIKRKWRRHRRVIASRRPQQRQRRLSSMVPQLPADPLPDKPPAYEEIIRIPTVSQSVAHTTGSLRSLPPAYSPTDETSTDVEVTTQTEITPTAPPAEVPQQPSTLTKIETNQGVVNDSFVPDHNV